MGEHDLAEAAADYLNAGLEVIALAGKMPNGKVHQHGLNDAISGTVETVEDADLLFNVFRHPDTTGVGIVIPPGLCVVDIDGEEGAVQYQKLAGEDVPETAVAKTGRGLHIWFVSDGEMRSTKLGPKLDLKGVGGYVAAPPSLHPDGHRYEWLVPLVDGTVTGVDYLPDGIREILALRQQIEAENTEERPIYYEYQLSLQNGAWRLRRTLCPPPIDGLLAAVRGAEEGNRNNILAWAVLQARDEGVTLEVALQEFGGAAKEAGLDDREVRTTIRSAYRRSRRG